MNDDQAFQVATSISQNENMLDGITLSNQQIGMYLIDAGYAESDENIAKVREA